MLNLNLSDNVTHLIALIGLLATAVLLVIFAHSYISADYVFGTIATMAGALFGYKFGVGSSDTQPPAAPQPVQLPPMSVVPPNAG